MSLTLTSISSPTVRSISGNHKRGRIAKNIHTVIAEFPDATVEELLEKLLAHHSNAHEYTPKELSKKITLCKKQTPAQPYSVIGNYTVEIVQEYTPATVQSSNSEEVAIKIESVYSGESLTSVEDNSAEPSQPEHKCCACETRLENIETAFTELTHDTNHFMHITSGNMHTRIEQVNNAILEQTAKIEMLSKWRKARFEEQEQAINVRFEQQEQRIINKLDKYSRKVTETLKKHIANKIEEFKEHELAEQPTPQDETEEPTNKNIYLNLITTCIFTAMVISFVY